jgi:hypothetical protein
LYSTPNSKKDQVKEDEMYKAYSTRSLESGQWKILVGNVQQRDHQEDLHIDEVLLK